jgi:hypothetical protein
MGIRRTLVCALGQKQADACLHALFQHPLAGALDCLRGVPEALRTYCANTR